MARPKKTEKLQGLVRNATKDSYEKVKKVCNLHQKEKLTVKDACAKIGWSEPMFYKCIRKYGDCKKLANNCGIGLKFDVETRPAKITAPEIPPDKSFTIFDLLKLKKHWTTQEKLEAIQVMLEKLSKGIPLAYSCALAGIDKQRLEEWCRECPELIERIRHGDAPFIEQMMGWLTEAGVVASKQGKFGEILKGVEQRLPEKWGALDRIDVVTRRDNEENVLSLSADKARSVGSESSDADFVIIEEKK